MKQYQYLGIICSLVLMISWLIVGPSMELISISDRISPFYDIYIYFVLQTALLGFFFALFGRLKQLKEKKISNPLLIIITLCCFLLINNFIKYFEMATLESVKVAINLTIIAVFIIWIIRIFKTKKYNFKKLKQFGISYLLAWSIVFLYSIINIFFKDQIIKSGRNPFEFIYLVSSVYSIGFFFGLIFFIRRMPAPNNKAS